MKTKYTVIHHDPFARTSVLRRIVRGSICDFCGNSRWKNGKQAETLFQYGTAKDDDNSGARTSWENRAFCSKSCHDAYHG